MSVGFKQVHAYRLLWFFINILYKMFLLCIIYRVLHIIKRIMYCILFSKLKIHKCGCHSKKCKIKNSTENWNIPQLRKNNKYGRKPRRTSKGNSKKMWHNKQGINTTGAKNQVGKDKIRVKLKLFDTCLMTALVYGMEAWGSIKLMEMREIENIQGKTLERIFQLPVSTT